jgi:hypothetical protein
MSRYLQLHSGPVAFLLGVDCIQEVGAVGDIPDSSGLRLWRDKQIRVWNMPRLFGFSGPCTHQVVVQENSRLVILDVDQIAGLMTIEENRFQPFSPVTAEASRYFDHALPLPDGRCLLRLRRPLGWLDDGL